MSARDDQFLTLSVTLQEARLVRARPAARRPMPFAPRSPFGAYSDQIGAGAEASHRAEIRVYDNIGNVIKTHEHAGEFREP
jgi:hypothetical protein